MLYTLMDRKSGQYMAWIGGKKGYIRPVTTTWCPDKSASTKTLDEAKEKLLEFAKDIARYTNEAYARRNVVDQMHAYDLVIVTIDGTIVEDVEAPDLKQLTREDFAYRVALDEERARNREKMKNWKPPTIEELFARAKENARKRKEAQNDV